MKRFVLAGTLIFSTLSYGQFKKYESNTNLNAPTPAPPQPATDLIVKPSKDDTDVFGRSDKDNQFGEITKDDKYVNLNPETAFGPEVITSFDFPDTSLVDLTKHMQKLTGINLILDKDLKGKVSIMAPSPITVGDAWKAYLTALNINNYTLVKSGAFYKIVNARDIRYTPTKIYTGNYTPDTENYVMRIIPLKNINSTEVTRSFRPFMSRYGRIIDIKQTNTIIAQDTGSNINRLIRLIKFVDVPGHEETLQIIKVKNSSAQELAKLLDQILNGGSSRGGSGASSRRSGSSSSSSSAHKSENISKIIAEPRTNSIIAMADALGAKKLRSLIKKLDVEQSASNGGQIHVYYLNHGDAEALSKTLSTLVGNAQKAASSSRRSSKLSSRNNTNSNSLFNADVKVTADKDNNAIVVTASPTDYLTIKEVIKKLDIPRDQVYVEGLIMETQVNNSRGFGVNFIGATGTGNARRVGFNGGDKNINNLLTGNVTSLGGLFAGIGSGKNVDLELPTGGNISVNTINGLVEAVASDANTNVLATPQILAMDNTEATFEVGEQIPTVKRTNASNGESSASIEYQPVTLSLKITPQINKVTRFIKLKIDNKIEDFSKRALPSNVQSEGLATTVRQAVTTVVVRDRDTIAMGGLMRDKEEESEDKVPLLGDLPVLGWLFKNTRTEVSKINLLMFLTPKILSPYQKETAATLKDVINRRSAHLKGAVDEKKTSSTLVKGLFEKAKKQGEGPLYDESDVDMYKRQNQGPGIGNDEDFDNDFTKIVPKNQKIDTPDYGMIIQKVESQKAGLKK